MKQVFVLGAGFSADHQFPLIRGLKERTIHFVEAERHSSYRSFLEPRDGFPKGLFYTGLDELDPQRSLGFEELLLTLTEAKRLGNASGAATIVGKVMRIGAARLIWCMTYFIWKVQTAYANFARQVSTQGDSGIITFNWDILVEKAFTHNDAEWSYSMLTGAGTPIIKPHGSINRGSFAQNSNLSAEYPHWRPIAPGSTLSYDSKNPICNPDMQEINPDLRYCLYPGDPDHPEFHADLERIWLEAESLLQAAEKIVFIGYSLPTYDSFTLDLLRRTCVGKSLEVYDPWQPTLDRFAAEFPNAALHSLPFRASPYAAG